MTAASRLIVAHAVALFACGPALSESPSSKASGGARSVAELMQRREDARLHEQLQREGKMEELRELEASIARREQAQRQDAAAQLNAQIAGSRTRAKALQFDTCDLTAPIR